MGKFVLITWPRSGSTAMKTALYHHPDISFQGDAFNKSDMQYQGYPLGKDGVEKVFMAGNGFLLMPIWNGIDDGDMRALLEYDNPEVRYVVLWRQNVLRMIVSDMLCRKNNAWMADEVKRFVDQSKTFGCLPVDEIAKLIWYREWQFKRTMELLQEHSRKYRLVYHADLFDGPFEKRIEVFRAILEFVGFAFHDIPEIVDNFRPGRKHIPVEAYRRIENVDEIEAAFSAKYGSLFEHGDA